MDNNYLQQIMDKQAAQMREQMRMGGLEPRTATSFTPTLSETRVEKEKLLGVLRENLAKHRAEYESAMNDYWEALEIYHATQLTHAKARNLKGKELPPPQMPTSQAKEYEKVIRQLELSIDDKVVLNDTQFQTYVMDDWFWKPMFAANNQTLAMYKSIDRSATR